MVFNTYSSNYESKKKWYSLTGKALVDGGADSDWIAFESFVKMTGSMDGVLESGSETDYLGHPTWEEDQSGAATVKHSPTVNLIFGGADVY